jgi:predicted ATPase
VQKSPRNQEISSGLHNLPSQLTSFVGREQEISEIKSLLDKNRSLTLVGTGGVGKTRLCLEVANKVSNKYPDGVWLVEFSSLSEPDLVVDQVYSAMGLRKEARGSSIEDLSDYLHEKELLLILDNCEHLVLVFAELAQRLLLACPKVEILATSRESLGYSGEILFQVPSLKLPRFEETAAVEEIVKSEAVKLLVARIQTFQPTFQINLENVPAIIQICNQLEGIPLALELAAARVNFLSLPQIASHLESSLQLLTRGDRVSQPRQQTMQATIEWSYALLDRQEQTLFRYLAIFRGGFTLDDVESVCAGEFAPGTEDDVGELIDLSTYAPDLLPSAVLDLLSNLVDKSLIVVVLDQEAIYRMLRPIQQFVIDRLSESDEYEYLKHRHLHHYLELAEEARMKIRSAEQTTWLNRLEIEHDNFRAALDRTLESGLINSGLMLAEKLEHYWYRHGHLKEGVGWLERLLKADYPHNLVYARALLSAGNLTYSYGDLERAQSYAKQGLELSEKLEDKGSIAQAHSLFGTIAHFTGNRQEGIGHLEEGLALFRELGDDWNIARTLLYLGDAYIRSKNFDRATILLDECLPLFRDLGDKWGIGFALGDSGELARQKGDHGLALAYFREALALHIEQGDKIDVCYLIEHIAITMLEQGDPSKAAMLWGVADYLRESLHAPPPPSYLEDYAPYRVAMRSSLGEGAFQEAWEKGYTMEHEKAINQLVPKWSLSKYYLG